MRIFSSILPSVLIFVILFTGGFISHVLLKFFSCGTKINCHQLKIVEAVEPVQQMEPYEDADHGIKGDTTAGREVALVKEELKSFSIFSSAEKAREFDARVGTFLSDQAQCQVQFFMTWIAPAASFGGKQFWVMESLFKAHPNACLVILSRELESGPGFLILKPLLDRGYRVAALDPDLKSLFNNTPTEAWLNDIQSGRKNPGKIPLAQNLSNLMRLAVLYKYGGVYLDTDFIVLRDFSRLRNTIGAQSVDDNGKWTALNNAVLVFDKNHLFLYECMKDFHLNFNGNRWGQNGPYLLSRVVKRVAATYNFTILPPVAFYPVDWNGIDAYFKRPTDSKWARNKLLQLNGGNETYGIHLWNKVTGRARIEEGSIMANLISSHCIICHNIYVS